MGLLVLQGAGVVWTKTLCHGEISCRRKRCYFDDCSVSRKLQCKDICRTIEVLQCTHIFKAKCCLKVHNALLKLASAISGWGLMLVTPISTTLQMRKVGLQNSVIFKGVIECLNFSIGFMFICLLNSNQSFNLLSKFSSFSLQNSQQSWTKWFILDSLPQQGKIFYQTNLLSIQLRYLCLPQQCPVSDPVNCQTTIPCPVPRLFLDVVPYLVPCYYRISDDVPVLFQQYWLPASHRDAHCAWVNKCE